MEKRSHAFKKAGRFSNKGHQIATWQKEREALEKGGEKAQRVWKSMASLWPESERKGEKKRRGNFAFLSNEEWCESKHCVMEAPWVTAQAISTLFH